MIKPTKIKKGDTIGIVSPAGKIIDKYVMESREYIESLGYKVKLSSDVFAIHHQFAGDDEKRASAFQEMLDDDEIKVILCSRGGYGSIRIIDKIDFTNFSSNPKWIVGFSDITTFHSHLVENINCCSIHGFMPKTYNTSEAAKLSINELFSVLEGENPMYNLPYHPLNKKGIAEGKLIGGNLAIILNLRGTAYDFNPEGRILFLEDVGEYLYNIDRMMMNLKVSGILEKISGLIVGQFTDPQDNDDPFGMNPYEIIYEKVKEYDYPVCFGFDAGHELPNHPLIMGSDITLCVDREGGEIKF